MTHKKVLALGVFLLVLLAVYYTEKSTEQQARNQPHETLLNAVSVDAVHAVKLLRGEESVVLERNDSGWALPARAGYPADGGKVRALLLKLFDLRAFQMVTDNSENYSRLGVEALDGNQTGGIQLLDEAGEPLAGVILGNTRAPRPGIPNVPQSAGQYVRLEGDSSVVLVSDIVAVMPTVTDWLDTGLVNVLSGRIERIEFDAHQDGAWKRLVVLERARNAEHGKEFVPVEGGEDKQLSAAKVSPVASGLENLRLVDVQAVDAEAPVTFDRRTVYTAVSGLEYVIDTVKRGDKVLAEISVRLNTDMVNRISSLRPAADSGEAKAADGESSADKSPEEFLSDLSAVEFADAERAASLDKRLSGWVYDLPSYVEAKLRPEVAELFQTGEPEAPAADQ
ncbi:MAG: DUF4340 domain-containing protein [Bdellovibrionales bacterium]|nr:DUF4340 domain-containing protein [Bdellovibrionales bacterium]